MLHREFEPPEELRDTIKCFWYNRRDAAEPQTDFEVIPDDYAEIIFYFGNLTSISYKEGLQSWQGWTRMNPVKEALI